MTIEFICGDCGETGDQLRFFKVPSDGYQGESKLAVKFAKKCGMGYVGCPECKSPNLYFDIDEVEEPEVEDAEDDDEIDLDDVDDLDDDEEDEDEEEEDDEPPPPPKPKKKKKNKRKKKAVSADDSEKPRKKKKRKKKRKASGDFQPQLAPEGKRVTSPLAGMSEGKVVQASHTVPQEVNLNIAAASDVANELGDVTRFPRRPRRMYRKECRECFDDFETKHQDVVHCKKCLKRFRAGR